MLLNKEVREPPPEFVPISENAVEFASLFKAIEALPKKSLHYETPNPLEYVTEVPVPSLYIRVFTFYPFVPVFKVFKFKDLIPMIVYMSDLFIQVKTLLESVESNLSANPGD